jgi:glycosyltransferase involved in cell wall biosynthesis
VVCSWLERAAVPYDVAMVEPVGPGLDWRNADPAHYSHVVYVCGPFLRGELETSFFSRFAGCRLIGVDLTMLESLSVFNPFDHLLERDSDRTVRPDIAFAATEPHVPVIGVCLVEDYAGPRVRVADANRLIERFLSTRDVAVVRIDTRLDQNSTGLRTPSQVETLLARMDAVITTRLHGMVLSLKNGVPVVAIDPEEGGAKIVRQAECLQWPWTMPVEAVTEAKLQAALDHCLTPAARIQASDCRERALTAIEAIRADFTASLTNEGLFESRLRARTELSVAVIIPCYNQARYLADAIDSVRAQTHGRTEIVVVDDGSDDDTAQVAARYPEVVYVRQYNAGLAAARNAGLKAVQSEYVVFLDADDRMTPRALESGLNCMDLYPECPLVSGHFRYIRADGSPRAEAVQEVPHEPPYQALLQRNYIGMHATVMYRRSVFDTVGPFDPALKCCEDYDVYLRIARRFPVAWHREIVAEYRIHGEGMSTHAARMLNTAMDVLAAQWPHIRTNSEQVRAYRRGVRFLRWNAIRPLLTSLSEAVEDGRWLHALRLGLRVPLYAVPLLRSVALDARLTVLLGPRGKSDGRSRERSS